MYRRHIRQRNYIANGIWEVLEAVKEKNPGNEAKHMAT